MNAPTYRTTMQVSEIATGPFETVSADADAASVRSILATAESGAVFVTDGRRPGLITRCDAARSDASATAGTLATPLPALREDDGLRDAAEVLVANRVPVVPVVSDGEPVGRVAATAVLERAPDVLGTMTVAEARSRSTAAPPTRASVDDAGDPGEGPEGDPRAGVSFGGELVGADTGGTTTGSGQPGSGPTPGPSGRRYAPPSASDAGAGAEDEVGATVAPVRPGSPVAAAVETMLQSGRDGIPVSPGPDGHATGVLTRTGVLKALAGPDRSGVALCLVNGHRLQVTTRGEIATRLMAIIGADRGTRPRGTVRLLRAAPDAGADDSSRTQCVITVRTADDRRSVTARAEDAERALSDAMARLERAPDTV